MHTNRSSYYQQRRQSIQQFGSRHAAAAIDASAIVTIIRQHWPTFSLSTVSSAEQLASFVEGSSSDSCRAVVAGLLQLIAKPVASVLNVGENCESTVFVRSESPRAEASAGFSSRRATVVRSGQVSIVSPQTPSISPPCHALAVECDAKGTGSDVFATSGRGSDTGNFLAFKTPSHQSETPHRMLHDLHRSSIQSAVFVPAIHTHKTKVVEDDDDDTILQINQYCIVDEAGRGMYGTVKIAVKDNDPLVYAIKIISRRRMRTATLPRQASDGSIASFKTDDDSRGKEPDASLIEAAVAEKDADASFVALRHAPTAQHLESSENFIVPLANEGAIPSQNLTENKEKQQASNSQSDSDLPTPPPRRSDSMKAQLVPVPPQAPPPLPPPPANSQRLQVDIAESSSCDFSTAPTPKQFQDEVEVMKKLHHRNVVRLIEVIDDPADSNLYLVMPYCDRGPIMSLGKELVANPLDVDVAKGYMRQITAGLAYLHSHGLAHLDLKPDNILLDGTLTCYLSDFGTSKFIKKRYEVQQEGELSQLSGFRGTPAFAAPEVISVHTYDPFAADMWSLGVTFYALIFGRLPFSGATLPLLLECILHTEPDFTTKPSYNVSVREDGDDEGPDLTDAIDLMKLLLQRNPLNRPKATSVRSHPFISQRKPRKGLPSEIREEVAKARVE